jgi:hypothetical protein
MVTLNATWGAGRGSVLRLLAAVALLGWAANAGAQPITADSASSDLPAGYIVFPKIVVHTTGSPTAPVLPGGTATDTLIQLTNTNEAAAINVDCWWVNANSHCGGCTTGPIRTCGSICTTTLDCPLGLSCVQGWVTDDFQIRLTPGQPIAFTASSGLNRLPCDPGAQGPGCPGSPANQAMGTIRPAPEDPFMGELKCVEVDDDDDPVPANHIKGEATIVSTTVQPAPPVPPILPGTTTAAAYNGIGFQADQTFIPTQNPTDPLCLGALPPGSGSAMCNQQYAPCPGVLILNHFFDGAATEIGGIVDTELVLAPCSEDLGNITRSGNFQVLAQLLIYNEFEQRFSSSSRVTCYRSTRLSDIDTGPGPAGDAFSIFSVGVQGTIAGQTRIRGVQGAPNGLGYGLLGVACENYHAGSLAGPILSRTAFNLHQDGFRQEGDAVYLEVLP